MHCCSNWLRIPTILLGLLILNAKNVTTDNDVRRTWVLLGDPSMKLHFGVSGSSTAATEESFGPIHTGDCGEQVPERDHLWQGEMMNRKMARALFGVTLAVFACKTTIAQTAQQTAALGLVAKNSGGRIGDAAAAEGSSIYSGDYLSTSDDGSLLVRIGALSLELQGSTGAHIYRAPSRRSSGTEQGNGGLHDAGQRTESGDRRVRCASNTGQHEFGSWASHSG